MKTSQKEIQKDHHKMQTCSKKKKIRLEIAKFNKTASKITVEKKVWRGLWQVLILKRTTFKKVQQRQYDAVWYSMMHGSTLLLWHWVMTHIYTSTFFEVNRVSLCAKFGQMQQTSLEDTWEYRKAMTWNIMWMQLRSFWRSESGIFCSDQVSDPISTWSCCISLA